MERRSVLSLLLLACLYTGLNACKPPHIDDAAYYYYARQIAQHLCDPYGFSLIWYDEPNEANDILAPPVLPAWWALHLRLFGNEPWLWKLGLWPWCVLLTFALHALFRRFTPGLEGPLTWLTVLSPALLPSLNLMLDVPALALSLAAVVVFLRACDRNSAALAVGAGLLAGVASQTKYTAFLAPGVMLLTAATRNRWRLWPGALVAPLLVFLAWESLTDSLYGRSHFLNSLGMGAGLSDKIRLFLPLVGQLGGTFPAVVLLGLAALGCGPRVRLAAVAVAASGFALVAALPNTLEGVELSPLPGVLSLPSSGDFQIAHAFFCVLGLGGAAVIGFVLRRLWTESGKSAEERSAAAGRRDTLFLVLWLALEVIGYFALTPFGAVRRVLGLTVILTLLVGRLSARLPTAARRRAIREACCFGIVLGLALFALDLRETQVHRTAAEDAAAWVRRQGGGRVWYIGHWGWQFHAERNGMEPVIVEYKPSSHRIPMPPPSRLRAGDWLVVPDERVDRQHVELDAAHLREEVRLRYADAIPLRTLPCFYGGMCPIEHHDGDRLTVTIYRVTAAFTPRLGAGLPGRQEPLQEQPGTGDAVE